MRVIPEQDTNLEDLIQQSLERMEVERHVNKVQKRLERRFEKFTEEVEPLENEFDPEEEVEDILTCPKEERHKALRSYLDKFGRQIQAWATYYDFVIQLVTAEPNTPRETLETWMTRFAKKYGFPQKQIGRARFLLTKGYIYHENARDMLQEFEGRKRDLVTTLTDVDPGYVPPDIHLGPACINIGWTWEAQNKFSKNSLGSQEIHRDQNVLYTTQLGLEISARPGTLAHETQHVINYIIFGEEEENLWDYLEQYYDENNMPEFSKTMKKWVLNQAKEELLADFKEGADIDAYDFRNNKAYDYNGRLKKYFEIDDEEEEPWKPYMQDFFDKDYIPILKRAKEAMKRLQREGGLTKDQCIGALLLVPVNKWPRHVGRLLGEPLREEHVPQEEEKRQKGQNTH